MIRSSAIEHAFFHEALSLRDQIEALGWPHDLLAVEAWGQDVRNKRPPRGYRVVLAWADGRLRRINTLAEARRVLAGMTSGGRSPWDVHHAIAGAPPLSPIGEETAGGCIPIQAPGFSVTVA